jgi:hypothetical protein
MTRQRRRTRPCPSRRLRLQAYLRDVVDRAGVDLFHLSRVMGTSLRMIDRTYGHLAPDAHAYIRGKLDAYDSVDAKEAMGERTLAWAGVPE